MIFLAESGGALMWVEIVANTVVRRQSGPLPRIWAQANALLYFLLDGTDLALRFREAQYPRGAGVHAPFAPFDHESVPQASLHGRYHPASRPHRRGISSNRGAYRYVYRDCACLEYFQDAGTVWIALTHRPARIIFHGARTWPRAYQPDGNRPQCFRHGQRTWLHEGDGTDRRHARPGHRSVQEAGDSARDFDGLHDVFSHHHLRSCRPVRWMDHFLFHAGTRQHAILEQRVSDIALL